jgi:hypothetical protein
LRSGPASTLSSAASPLWWNALQSVENANIVRILSDAESVAQIVIFKHGSQDW